MPTIRLTPQMKQRLTRRAYEMVERSLSCFPELKDATITIGYTRKHLGSATVIYRKGVISRLIIRLKSAQGHLSNHRPRADAFDPRLGPRRSYGAARD